MYEPYGTVFLKLLEKTGMRGLQMRKNVLLATMSLLSILCCKGQQLFTRNGTDSIEAVTVVRTSDRIPLYPSNGHDADARNFVYPNVIQKNGIINVFATTEFDIIELISGNGVLMFQQNIKQHTGRLDIPLKNAVAGIYYLRMRNRETAIIQKLVVTE